MRGMSDCLNSSDAPTGQAKATWSHFATLLFFFVSLATSVGWYLTDLERRKQVEENWRQHVTNGELAREVRRYQNAEIEAWKSAQMKNPPATPVSE